MHVLWLSGEQVCMYHVMHHVTIRRAAMHVSCDAPCDYQESSYACIM